MPRKLLPVMLALLCLAGCSNTDATLPATVTAATPTTARAGDASLNMHLVGANFHAFTWVAIQNTPVQASVGGKTSDTLDVTIPASLLNSAGIFPIEIWTDTAPTTSGVQNYIKATTKFSLEVTNPIPIVTGSSPAPIPAGSGATTVTLTGGGFVSTSTVTVNGVRRQAGYINSSRLSLALTADDVATAGSASVVVTNPAPGGGASNTAILSIAQAVPLTRYTALGDSITAGLYVGTAAYPHLVADALKLTLTNAGYGGDSVCDIFPRQMIGVSAGQTPGTNYSLMIGSFDAQYHSAEANFNNCQQAVLSWVGTRRSDRLIAGDAALQTSGSCANTSNAAYLYGIYCAKSVAGSITAPALLTTGNAIYIWYRIADAGTGSFNVTIDGSSAGIYQVAPSAKILTHNGGSVSVGLVRATAAAGQHKVEIMTANGDVAILGIGSNTAQPGFVPVVALGTIPNTLQTNPAFSEADAAPLRNDVIRNMALFKGDGLDVRYVDTRASMPGTSTYLIDQIHPYPAGHQLLAQPFISVFQQKP